MIEDERVAVGPAGLPQVHAGEGRRAAAAAGGPEVGADDDVVVGGQVGHARDRDQAQPSAPQVVVLLRLLLLSILFCILASWELREEAISAPFSCHYSLHICTHTAASNEIEIDQLKHGERETERTGVQKSFS